MPDVQEVFRMATQKIRPELGFVDRQLEEQRRRARNRKTGALALVAVIGVVLALIAIRVAGGADRPTPADDMTGQPPLGEVAASEAFTLHLGSGEITPLPSGVPDGYPYEPSPDGSMVATMLCCDPPVPVMVSSIDGSEVREITPDGVDGYGPRWSPDGSMIVYQGRDGWTQELGNLFVFDVASGATTRVTDLEPRSYGWWFLSPSFSADGRSILFQLPRGERGSERWDLWSVRVEGGDPVLVRRDASMGAYAPDGRLSYLDPSSGDWTSSTLLLTDPEGGRPTLLAEGNGINWPRWSPDGTRMAYVDDDEVFVVDVTTGRSERVADGGTAEWLGNDTLVVTPPD